MRFRLVAWTVLVPALALAAPRASHKPRATPKPDKTEGATEPAEPDAAKDDKTKPAEAPKDAPADKAKAAPTTAPATPAGGAGAGGSGDKPAEQPAATNEPDVDSLRQEYMSLRDELFKSRARANAVASQLYSTRVTIKLTWGSARFYGVSKASIRLDGATVYEDATGAIASDDGVRFDGYVAPGKHLVTFHVEATGKDDDSFTSITESQIVVKAIAEKDLVVAAKGKDSGDIAYAWKRQERGSYGLGIDVLVKSVPQGGAAPAKGPKK